MDADLKRYKWMGDMTLYGSIAMEILTPLAPGSFLLVASIANVIKVNEKNSSQSERSRKMEMRER